MATASLDRPTVRNGRIGEPLAIWVRYALAQLYTVTLSLRYHGGRGGCVRIEFKSHGGRAAMLPVIHYRLLTDDLDWFVRWRCGSVWLLVYGPATEAQAREWVDGMMAQQL